LNRILKAEELFCIFSKKKNRAAANFGRRSFYQEIFRFFDFKILSSLLACFLTFIKTSQAVHAFYMPLL